MYIAIEGVIGVGKTSLARLLKTPFQSNILLEIFEENPFLAKFYEDRDRYAFQTLAISSAIAESASYSSVSSKSNSRRPSSGVSGWGGESHPASGFHDSRCHEEGRSFGGGDHGRIGPVRGGMRGQRRSGGGYEEGPGYHRLSPPPGIGGSLRE